MTAGKRRRRRASRSGTPGREQPALGAELAPAGYCFFCGEPLNGEAIYGVKGTLRDDQDCSSRAGGLVDIDLCGFRVAALAVPPGSPAALAGAQLLFPLCSDGCAKALRLAALLDRFMAGEDSPDENEPVDRITGLKLASTQADSGTDEPESRQDDDRLARVTEALERLGASTVLHDRCAWCFPTIGEEEPVIAVHVVLHGDPDLSDYEGGMTSILIAGRPVPGRVPEAGSPASLNGHLGFMLCSPTCADELTAAINEDIRISVVH